MTRSIIFLQNHSLSDHPGSSYDGLRVGIGIKLIAVVFILTVIAHLTERSGYAHISQLGDIIIIGPGLYLHWLLSSIK